MIDILEQEALPNVITDPNGAYPHASRAEIIQTCGYVLPWVLEWGGS